MWTDAASIATTFPPHVLWRVLEDVARWTNCKTPGAMPKASDVADPAVPQDPARCLVSHTLQPLPGGGTRITYAIRVEGLDAGTPGPMVTTDLCELLAALKALAQPRAAGPTGGFRKNPDERTGTPPG